MITPIPSTGAVQLTVYDITGRYVRRIEAPGLAAGRNALLCDGRDGAGRSVSSGACLYRFRAGGRTLTGRMMMVK